MSEILGLDLDQVAARSGCGSEAPSAVIWDEALPGERRIYCRDPWGNRLELLATTA